MGGFQLKSIYADDYRHLLQVLIKTRKDAGITQQGLALAMRRPQSFVSKIERGERRLDLVEFLRVIRLIGGDPHKVIDEIEGKFTTIKGTRPLKRTSKA